MTGIYMNVISSPARKDIFPSATLVECCVFRQKLDEVKRMEVEYQRDLLRQRKDHMQGVQRNYWNPIHHDNKETFEKDDMLSLLTKVCSELFRVVILNLLR